MKIFSRKHLFQLAGLLVLDGIVFGLTNASSASSFVLIIGFALLAATLYNLVYSILVFVGMYGLKLKHKQRLAIYLTSMLSGIVALQSIGELGGKDILVLLPLLVIGYLYSFYGKTSSDRSN